jgi:hypothetical protein
MFSTTPLRLGCVLKRMGAQLSESETQFLTSTLRMPPDVSLPIATPPWP